jgi:hypothetical protein
VWSRRHNNTYFPSLFNPSDTFRHAVGKGAPHVAPTTHPSGGHCVISPHMIFFFSPLFFPSHDATGDPVDGEGTEGQMSPVGTILAAMYPASLHTLTSILIGINVYISRTSYGTLWHTQQYEAVRTGLIHKSL